MSFIRLVRMNDWGTEYLCREKTPTADVKNAIPLYEGQQIVVRWPDLSVSKAVVIYREHTGEVGDHGRSYAVSYKFPHVRIDYRGIRTYVPLDKLEIDEDSL